MIGGQVLAPRSKPRRPVQREADRARHLKTGPAALLPQAPIRIHASPRTRHPSVIARAIMKIRVQAIHREASARGDRKSTRLNSSHVAISYAVFCLKKKKIL